MNKLNHLIIFWLCSMAVQAQNIIQAEYFFDVDPGPGNATMVSGFSADDTVTFPVNVSVTGLTEGFHFIAVRVKDDLNRWSHFEKRGFYIYAAPVAMPDIVAAEYFFDQDPGPGNANSVSIGTTNDSLSFMAMIPQSLAGGFHTLAIRIKDQNGRWSLFEKRTFYVSPSPVSMPDIAAAEYFIGADPGVGNGIPVSTGSPDDTITQPLTIPIPPSTPLGTYFYTTRVKDVTGKWSHFNYDTVFVAISVPEDTILNAAPGLCSKVVNGIDAQVINSEPYSYTLTGATTGSGSGSASGLAFNAGVTIVTYTLDNFPTATASFTVTVIDSEIPIITCPANISIGADENVCGAVVNYSVTFSDNCPGVSLLLLSGLASGSTFPAGMTNNTFRAMDSSGNSSTCSFSVTVSDDVPPMLICPANLTVNTDPGVCTASNVVLGSPTVSDNCLMDTTINNAFATYPLGVTPVTWTATDAIGNTSTCIQNITVVDNQNPVVTCPANITMNADPGTCTKSVTYSASATDNCGVSGITYSPTSGSTFSIGITIVTATVTDINGRTSSCTFTVTIVDNEDPVITCQSNITVNAEFGLCAEEVSFGATATDNCGTPTISFNPVSGSSFPVGINIVTATATDAGGRTDTCTFTVTVIDVQPPSISCPANITVNTDSGACTASGVSLGSPVVSDNCGIAMTSNNGLSIYPVGITNILWTTTDANGLTATCTQTVTVVDTEPPVITDCPQNIVTTTDPGECAAVINFSFAGTDQCGLQSIVSTTFQSGEQIPVGFHIIAILATDINGNTSTCSFTVEITDDETPQIFCPTQINEYSDPDVCDVIIIFNVSATDNCTISPSIISNPASGSAFPVGSTIVTSTATDAGGNSQSCTFVIIIEDEEPPTISCPSSITVNTDIDQCTAGSVELGTPFTYDNCGVASITNNGLSAYPLGITNVIWTVTDVHGLTATCVHTVTVVDNQAPQITCPADMTVFAGPGSTTIVNYDAPIVFDNCPFVNMMQTTGLPSGSAFPLGTTVNTFVATDANGFTASCSFSVLLRKGKVGVNTTAPLAMLHVVDSSVVFTGPATLPDNPVPPPVSGAGNRMMWYPQKAALRIGGIDGGQWDRDSIGNYSFAAGYNVKASGSSSIALGSASRSTGNSAISIGTGNLSNNQQSVAIGYNNKATGNQSIAIGDSTDSSGSYAFGMGHQVTLTGESSVALGYKTKTTGTKTVGVGLENHAKSFGCFVTGRFNDTTSISSTFFNSLDPVFIIGNGSGPGDLRNAFTVLKNGKTGLFTSSPTHLLHVTSNESGNLGYKKGIMIENQNNSPGEPAISFKNTSFPSSRQWILGSNETSSFSVAYGSSFTSANTRLFLDTLGRFGINTILPTKRLHVVRNSPVNGILHPDAIAVYERSNHFYFQLSNLTGDDSGILSGNQSTAVRSGFIFTGDSSLICMTGGDTNQVKISKNGNVGIGNMAPSAKLDVAGATHLGINGTPFQEMIKATVSVNVPSVGNNNSTTVTVNIPNAMSGSSVTASPSGVLPDGLILAYSIVSAPSSVQLTFINKSGVTLNPAAMDYYFALIR